MSNIIPPLLSSSPPPIITNDEEEDDEFGDFTAAVDLSTNFNNTLSLPDSPDESPTKGSLSPTFENWQDVNNKVINAPFESITGQKIVEKDYQDKRKCESIVFTKEDVNITQDSEPFRTPESLSDSSDLKENTGDCTIDNIPPNDPISTAIPNVPTENSYSTLTDSQSNETPSEIQEHAVNNVHNSISNHFADFESTKDEDFGNFTEFTSSNETGENVVNEDISYSADVKKNNVNVELSNSLAVDSTYQNGDMHFEEPPDLPPDLGNDDEEFGDFESKSLEFDSESDSQHMPSESLVPFEENKDDFNYIGIIRSVRDETIMLNAPPDAVKIEDHDKNLENDVYPIDKNVISEDLTKGCGDAYEDSDFGDFNEYTMENGSNGDNFSNFKISSDTNEFNAFNGFKSDIPFADEKKSEISSTEPESVPPVIKTQEQLKAVDNKDKDSNIKDTTEIISNDNDDTFGDFSTFESEVVTNCPEIHQQKLDVITDSQPTFSEGEDDDEFGDFDDYSSNSMGNNTFGDFSAGPKDSICCMAEVMNNPKHAEEVIKQMFASPDEEPEEFKMYNFIEQDAVFNNVKNVTETCALSYQWPKSNSQEILLKALNIDMRNILHGPGWNPNIPRFASNMGNTPLEPMKPEILMPTPVQPQSQQPAATPTTTNSSNSSDIPSVQFDWTSSGLTNPLDYSHSSMMLLDLEHLVASLDIPSSQSPNPSSRNSTSPSKEYDEWENWLKSLQKESQDKLGLSDPMAMLKLDDQSETVAPSQPKQFDTESVNSLQLTEVPPEFEANDDKKSADSEFDDFTSFKSSAPKENYSNMSWSFDNMVPLRESYITASNNKDKKIDSEPSWLKPSIITPELPRKETNTESMESDDEFTDFQAGLPNNLDNNGKETTLQSLGANVNEVAKESGSLKPIEFGSTFEPLKPVVDNTNLQPLKPLVNNMTKEKAVGEGIMDTFAAGKQDVALPITQVNDVNFGILEPLKPATLEPLKSASVVNDTVKETTMPVLQPLTPHVLEPSKVNSNVNSVSSSINWPDPGDIDENEILSAFSYRKQDNLKKDNVANKKQGGSKSASGSPKIGGVKQQNKEDDDDDWTDFVSNQEVAPPKQMELQLSINHLSQIRPPKKSIPVITPHGLMQTTVIPTIASMKSESTNPTQIPNQKPVDSYRPAIISNHYNAQMKGLDYSNMFTQEILPPVNNHNHNYNKKTMQNHEAHFKQPIPPVQNSYNQNTSTMWNQSLFTVQGKDNTKMPTPSFQKQEEDDDDWTDFVSSQPVPQTATSFQYSANQIKPLNHPPQFSSWNAPSFTPNIITNPNNFETNLQVNGSKKFVPAAVPSYKSTVPSISALPDLEFIAPKGKTSKK